MNGTLGGIARSICSTGPIYLADGSVKDQELVAGNDLGE